MIYFRRKILGEKEELYFTCDKKFTPTHVCKTTFQGDDCEGIRGSGRGEQEKNRLTGSLNGRMVQLDIQSMVRLTPKRELKLWGTFLKSVVTILIDSGLVEQPTTLFLSRW